MINNDTETHDPLKENEVDKFRKLGNEIIEIGQEFTLGKTKYRIRKITNKDIVCRPIAWNQGEE